MALQVKTMALIDSRIRSVLTGERMDPILLGALSVLAGATVPKLLDFILAGYQSKRDFNKYRRQKAFEELDSLKNEIGTFYELAANWKNYDEKALGYAKMMENDVQLIGKFNKYPQIAASARDTVHLCKIVAFCEMQQRPELIENKKELPVKYDAFLKQCDKHLKDLGSGRY